MLTLTRKSLHKDPIKRRFRKENSLPQEKIGAQGGGGRGSEVCGLCRERFS